MFTNKCVDIEIEKRSATIRKAHTYLKEMTNFETWKIFEFNFNSQPFKDIQLENDLWKDNYVTYILEAIVTPENSIESYTKRKKQIQHLKNQNYSRLNNLPTHSDTLYVGSSKNFKMRLRQHLAVEPLISRATYSLWLNDWFKGKIRVSYYIFDDQIDKEVVQLVEDCISNIKQPLFGKKGPNGK